jgi:pre-mRNA-splicing factor ATP-dependent RNA helicase DHX16
LAAYGLPDNPNTHTFVNEVYKLAPRKSKSKSKSDAQRKTAEAEAKALRSQKYSFVEDDSLDTGTVNIKKDKGKGKEKERDSKSKRDKQLRKRDADGRDWESDEEDEIARKRTRADSYDGGRDDRREGSEEMGDMEDEQTRREREREEDLRERDAFAERMRERDKERTKKVVEDHSLKGAAAQDAARRRQLADDTTARVAAMPSLRERSRQDYLSKRELQQIELLRKEIQDDEALFRGMKVSKRERKELEYKKEVLRLAEERLKIDDRYDGYMLPEDYITEQGKIDKKRKEAVLYQRYEEAKVKDDQFVTDVDQWEASQTKHSTFKTGAMDREEVVDDYEYVFDESQTIQFVLGTTMNQEAMMSPADKLLRQQIEEAEKRGKSLG